MYTIMAVGACVHWVQVAFILEPAAMLALTPEPVEPPLLQRIFTVCVGFVRIVNGFGGVRGTYAKVFEEEGVES